MEFNIYLLIFSTENRLQQKIKTEFPVNFNLHLICSKSI